MGHLLAGLVQYLLPDQLGHQQLLGLVAHRIGRIEMGPLGQLGAQGRYQGPGAFAAEGAHRVQGPVARQLPVAGGQLLGPLRIHQVVLVEGHVHRRAAVLQQLHDEAIAPARRLAAIHQQQHHIHLADGTAGALHQALPQQVVGLVDARGVEQH